MRNQATHLRSQSQVLSQLQRQRRPLRAGFARCLGLATSIEHRECKLA